MTASSQFGVEQTLQLLEGLKGTVRDFAAREEKLDQELRSKTSAVRYRRDAAVEELTTRLAEQIAQADAAFRTATAIAPSVRRPRLFHVAWPPQTETHCTQGIGRIQHDFLNKKQRIEPERTISDHE